MLFKNINFDFKTKLTIEDHFARINITLPTKIRPIINQEIFINHKLRAIGFRFYILWMENINNRKKISKIRYKNF